MKAQDLNPNKPTPVTIESTELKEFDDGNKLIINFVGNGKALVCNKTNASRIEEVTGSDDTDDWDGKKIYLGVRKVEFQGKLVPAIRVLLPDEMPAPSKKPEPADEPDWEG